MFKWWKKRKEEKKEHIYKKGYSFACAMLVRNSGKGTSVEIEEATEDVYNLIDLARKFHEKMEFEEGMYQAVQDFMAILHQVAERGVV